MGEAACEPADERNNMTTREPTSAAVDAAEKLHPEYSDEWWKTIAQKSDRYGELYATARIKRNVTRAIIQTAIDTATAPLEARLAAAETALAAARLLNSRSINHENTNLPPNRP